VTNPPVAGEEQLDNSLTTFDFIGHVIAISELLLVKDSFLTL